MRRLLVVLCVASSLLGSSAAFADLRTDQYVLPGGYYLFWGQALAVPNCKGVLVMGTDGYLTLEDPHHRVLWRAGGVGGAYAHMQMDGNLVVANWSGQVLWSTNTAGNPFARLIVENGRLSVFRAGEALWQIAFDPGPDYLCPLSWITSTEADTNRYGGDFAHAQTDDPVVCAYWCSADHRCVAYSWDPWRGPDRPAMCWLKNSTPEQNYAPGMVSGRIFH